jgi:hypothetical protein
MTRLSGAWYAAALLRNVGLNWAWPNAVLRKVRLNRYLRTDTLLRRVRLSRSVVVSLDGPQIVTELVRSILHRIYDQLSIRRRLEFENDFVALLVAKAFEDRRMASRLILHLFDHKAAG